MADMEITATEIKSDLDKLSALPARVSGWEVETGIDAADEPAVWVWALLEDEEVDLATRSRLRDMVRDYLRQKAGAAKWVYVRFRGASEMV